jgi:hypothetical protein
MIVSRGTFYIIMFATIYYFEIFFSQLYYFTVYQTKIFHNNLA